MAVSDEAQRNHDAKFPDHDSTLKVTDPELIEIFDNWAFDEVIRDAPLEPRSRLMVQLAAIISCHAVHVAADLAVGNDRQALILTITKSLTITKETSHAAQACRLPAVPAGIR